MALGARRAGAPGHGWGGLARPRRPGTAQSTGTAALRSRREAVRQVDQRDAADPSPEGPDGRDGFQHDKARCRLSAVQTHAGRSSTHRMHRCTDGRPTPGLDLTRLAAAPRELVSCFGSAGGQQKQPLASDQPTVGRVDAPGRPPALSSPFIQPCPALRAAPPSPRPLDSHAPPSGCPARPPPAPPAPVSGSPSLCDGVAPACQCQAGTRCCVTPPASVLTQPTKDDTADPGPWQSPWFLCRAEHRALWFTSPSDATASCLGHSGAVPPGPWNTMSSGLQGTRGRKGH